MMVLSTRFLDVCHKYVLAAQRMLLHTRRGHVAHVDAVLHTPSVVVLYDELRENINSHQKHTASDLGLGVRPHVKTHKSLDIARMQIDAGAEGLTCSKATEGILFLENKICSSLSFAYPMLSETYTEKIFALAKESATELWFTVDSLNVSSDSSPVVAQSNASSDKASSDEAILMGHEACFICLSLQFILFYQPFTSHFTRCYPGFVDMHGHSSTLRRSWSKSIQD